jgi:hypothetical protein
VYVLDTSALIDAWTKWYSPLAIPRFWNNIEDLAERGGLIVPDAVIIELEAVDDDLYRWSKDREEIISRPTTSEIQDLVKAIAREYPNLRHAGVPGRNFADPVVIAVAEYNSGFVVTHENATGNINGPRIPDVCKAKGIAVMQMHHLVFEQGWKFD